MEKGEGNLDECPAEEKAAEGGGDAEKILEQDVDRRPAAGTGGQKVGVFQRKGGKGGESAEKAEHHHRQIRSQSFILLPEQHVDQSGDEGAENIDRHRRERQRIAAGCGQEADRRHPAERAERSGRP